MPDFRFSCPKCNREITCAVEFSGSQVNCPHCEQSITVPIPPVSPPEKEIRIKVSTLQNIVLIALAALFIIIIAAGIIYVASNSVRNIEKEWTVLAGDEGQWSYGWFKVIGETVNGDSILVAPKDYGDVTFSVKAYAADREASMALRMQDGQNGYLIVYAPVTKKTPENGWIELVKRVNNSETVLGFYRRKTLTGDKTIKLTVIAHGSDIEVQLNGKKIIRVNDSTFTHGKIGFRMYGWEDYPCHATFSGVKIH